MSVVPLSRVLTKISPSVNVEPGSSYPNAGVLNRGRGLFAKPPLAGGATAVAKLYRLSTGNVVYSKLFAWEGSVALVSDEFDGAYVSSEFPIFEVDRQLADLRYLHHALTWSKTLEQIAAMGSGLGQRRQRVNPDRFVTAEIPLPPLADQRRIAAHLDSVAEMAAKDGATGPSVQLRAVAFRLCEKFPWKVPLGEILTPRGSEVVDAKTTYRVAGIYSFGRGFLDRGAMGGGGTKYRTVTRLQLRDVAYSKLGAFENAVGVVDGAWVGHVVSPEFPVFSLSSHVDEGYLRFVLKSPRFADAMRDAAVGVGARQRRVSPGSFLALPVPIPCSDDQHRISKVADLVSATEALTVERNKMAAALLPAARNQVFSRLR